MPRYPVITPIEHEKKVYVPKGFMAAHYSPVIDDQGKTTGYTTPSGGNGEPLPVDQSGFIELQALANIVGPLRAAGALGDPLEEPEPKKKKG